MIDKRVMKISTRCLTSFKLVNVYLCIKPKNISLRIRSCAKLAPWFCEHFMILKRIGPGAYQLALPPIVKVHDVFHLSLLKKYVKYFYHVIDWTVLQVELEGEL